MAVLDIAVGTRPLIALLGDFASGADPSEAREAIKRTGCRNAIVSLGPEAQELVFVPRAGLTPAEFDRMLELEVTRFDLPFSPAEAQLASEVRARKGAEVVAVCAAKRAGVSAALVATRELGLATRALTADSLAYEEVLRLSGLAQAGRSTIVLELGTGAATFHVMDPNLEVRGRRVAWLDVASLDVVSREIERTVDHFTKTLKVPPITTVLVTSEAPLTLDLDTLTERTGVLVTTLDVTDKLAGTIDQRLSASMLRAVGLALCEKPRLDLQPVVGLPSGVMAGRAATIVGGLLTLFLLRSVVANRLAIWSAQSRIAAAKQELTELDPQIRRATEVRLNRERIHALRTRIRVLGSTSGVARLLEDLALAAAPEVHFDEILLREDKVEVLVLAACSEEEAPALRARFLERLERLKRLTNVGFDAPKFKGGLVEFKLQASILPGVS